jgi:hypothetical protein
MSNESTFQAACDRLGLLRKTLCGSLVLLVMTGCGVMKSDAEKLGYEPETRDIASAKGDVNRISSQLLDWMQVKGKLSQSGAGVDICEGIDPDMKKYYVIYHPWSVYDLKEGTFEAAMQNLRVLLPEHGWTITRDGKEPTKAADPEISATNRTTHHRIHIVWERSIRGSKPLINVSVNSRCFEAPKGTDIYESR